MRREATDGSANDDGGTIERTLRGMRYDGERIDEMIDVGDAGVAITSHRVLVLDPDGAPRFREVALPNVTDAGPDTQGDTGLALQALRFGAYATAVVAVSLLVDFESLASNLFGLSSVPSGAGVGQVVSIVRSIVDLIGLLDDALGLVGLGLALVALVHAVRYARSRTRALELAVSGDDPIRVPIERGDREAANRVGDAVDRAKASLGDP